MDSLWFNRQDQLSGDKISDRTQSYNSTVNYSKSFWL